MRTPSSGKKTALIVGASGLIGRALVRELLGHAEWDVVCASRHPPTKGAMAALPWIAVDVTSAQECRQQLGKLDLVSHIFYTARFEHSTLKPESTDINAQMLENVLDAMDGTHSLAHVHVVHGSKYYGHQLDEVVLPLREDSPRATGSNFYFDQEDLLIKRSSGRDWTFTTSRPHAFVDPSDIHPRSISLVFAVYACIQRKLGRQFNFPGTPAAYGARTQFTDLSLLAKAIHWMSCEPRCSNQAFNVVNGDAPRWCDLWRHFAQSFDVPVGDPTAMSLSDYMLDKEPVWQAVVARHGLKSIPLQALALWDYGDYQIRPQWDVVSSMDKARTLGFQDAVDSMQMFTRHFEYLRSQRIIP